MTDKEFLNWIIARLTHLFGDDPTADFIHRLQNIANKLDYLEKNEYHTTISEANYVKNLGKE